MTSTQLERACPTGRIESDRPPEPAGFLSACPGYSSSTVPVSYTHLTLPTICSV